MSDLLVIDDDVDFASLLTAALEAIGHEVAVGHTASSALDLVHRHAPDLLLIDLGLPDGDGKDVVRTIRAEADTPIIVVTSHYELDERVAALDAGADDLLLKPFSLDELAARVRAQLRRAGSASGTEPSELLVFGDLEIDPQTRRVIHAGSEVRFTPTEHQMLLRLASHPGELVTHNQLYREVWPDGSAESGHYVRVYIQQIRRKLRDDAANPSFIATEHSSGYRWLPTPANRAISTS